MKIHYAKGWPETTSRFFRLGGPNHSFYGQCSGCRRRFQDLAPRQYCPRRKSMRFCPQRKARVILSHGVSLSVAHHRDHHHLRHYTTARVPFKPTCRLSHPSPARRRLVVGIVHLRILYLPVHGLLPLHPTVSLAPPMWFTRAHRPPPSRTPAPPLPVPRPPCPLRPAHGGDDRPLPHLRQRSGSEMNRV
jgi:hypothetical protein